MSATTSSRSTTPTRRTSRSNEGWDPLPFACTMKRLATTLISSAARLWSCFVRFLSARESRVQRGAERTDHVVVNHLLVSLTSTLSLPSETHPQKHPSATVTNSTRLRHFLRPYRPPFASFQLYARPPPPSDRSAHLTSSCAPCQPLPLPLLPNLPQLHPRGKSKSRPSS